MGGPRVAIVGVILESNRRSPVAGEEDFRSLYWLEGDEILDQCRAESPLVALETAAFVKAMDATGPWQPVPILLAASHPAGPVEADLIDTFVTRIKAGLAAAGPLDAVYVSNHGAMTATDREDPDGDVIAAARAAMGPDTPIVVTLDLHGNISERMVDDSDLIVGYRTNPHVDMVERGEEAAMALRLVLAGLAEPKPAFIRLPLTPASVALLTAEGPYADMIDYGQRRQAEMAGEILNVSLFGGFVFSDVSKNGVAIVVTARRDVAKARSLAREIAERGWDDRPRFRKQLMPVEDAVALTLDRDRSPVIFSDSGDNPGGGGTGRTTGFLHALHAADPQDVLYGSFYDKPLAEAAHAAGEGATIQARFNSHPGSPDDVPFEVEAKVVGVHSGDVIGRVGSEQGRTLRLGPCAALRVGGITVVVISDRAQTRDPVFFEMFGLDIAKAHTVVVKSRGHFRAGFLPWFPPERVFEVDTAGFTSPVLERLEWVGLPRPVYPLDEDTAWTAPDW
ncbi:MAG: M81 family metallopeptidase [Methyloligellaceae bacterium]